MMPCVTLVTFGSMKHLIRMRIVTTSTTSHDTVAFHTNKDKPVENFVKISLLLIKENKKSESDLNKTPSNFEEINELQH